MADEAPKDMNPNAKKGGRYIADNPTAAPQKVEPHLNGDKTTPNPQHHEYKAPAAKGPASKKEGDK